MVHVESLLIAQQELNELIRLHSWAKSHSSSSPSTAEARSRTIFPTHCMEIIRTMNGNNVCVDCGGLDVLGGVKVEPLYASVAHGTLLCRTCSKLHVEHDRPEVSSFLSLSLSLSTHTHTHTHTHTRICMQAHGDGHSHVFLMGITTIFSQNTNPDSIWTNTIRSDTLASYDFFISLSCRYSPQTDAQDPIYNRSDMEHGGCLFLVGRREPKVPTVLCGPQCLPTTPIDGNGKLSAASVQHCARPDIQDATATIRPRRCGTETPGAT